MLGVGTGDRGDLAVHWLVEAPWLGREAPQRAALLLKLYARPVRDCTEVGVQQGFEVLRRHYRAVVANALAGGEQGLVLQVDLAEETSDERVRSERPTLTTGPMTGRMAHVHCQDRQPVENGVNELVGGVEQRHRRPGTCLGGAHPGQCRGLVSLGVSKVLARGRHLRAVRLVLWMQDGGRDRRRELVGTLEVL